jgi:pSer/pThr/pTyr-binding forkhead associated (FHA) protein
MDVKLVVQTSAAKPQAFTMRGGEMIVGRQKGSGVRIPSGQVSRQHCLLAVQDDLLRVEDLSSANGTFINGRRIAGRDILRPGDKLRVGPITFVVHYQLTQSAIDQLLKENEEQLEVVAIDDVEVADQPLGGEVELVLEDEDLSPLKADEEFSLGPADPLEALRQIEQAAAAPPAKKKTAPPPIKKTTPPVKKKTTPPPRPPEPRPPEPAFDDVEVLGEVPPEPPKRVKLSRIEPAASADEPMSISPADEGENAAPDASMILGHKNWQMPAGQDLRDILAQIEKGKKE